MDIPIGRTIKLLAVAIFVAIVARRLKLPYTVGLVLTGLALALMRFDAGIILTREVIFDAILPPLLFEAALNIGWSELRRDLVPVVAISTFGVLLCGAVVAGGLVFALGWPVGSGARVRRADWRDRPDRSDRTPQRHRRKGEAGATYRE